MSPAAVPLGRAGSAKIRNPVHVLAFDVVTLGVYGIVWYYKVNRELALLGRVRHTTALGENPKNSLLALFPGLLIVVPTVVSMLNMVKRLRAAQGMAGIPEADQVSAPPAFLLLFFLAPVGTWYFQKRLNNVWRAAPAGPTADSVSAPASAGELT